MKQIQKLFCSIITVGLLFACSKKENHDDLLRKIMVQHMNGMETLKGLYKETVNENGDILFGINTEAEHYSLRGNYQRKNDYLVFNLYFIYWDGIAEGSRTAIYKNDGNNWASIFQEPIVDGVLDTIIDLNNDNVNEIILKVRTVGTRGKDPCDRLVLYGGKNSSLLEKIDVLAERINSDGKLIKDYTLSYEPSIEGSIIAVKSEEGDDLESDRSRKTTIHHFRWQSPVLIDLNNTDLHSSESPGKFEQNGLWGFRAKDGVVIQPQYIEMLDLSEGMIAIKNKESAWGFADSTGRIAIPCKYVGVSTFRNGKAVVCKNNGKEWETSYQYIDREGKEIDLFFSPVTSPDCIEEKVIWSYDKEWTDLSNCPNGLQTIKNPYPEGEIDMTYYPEKTIENVITEMANTESNVSVILKKFNGTPLEFTDDGKKYSITLEKNNDGKLVKVKVTYTLETYLKILTFEPKKTGVLVTVSIGG
jgi:hypothetical protein